MSISGSIEDPKIEEAVVGTAAAEGVKPPRRFNRRKRIGGKALTGLLIGYLLLVALALIYIYPFLISLSSSFKTDNEAVTSPLNLIPQTWSYGDLRMGVGTDQRWEVFGQ